MVQHEQKQTLTPALHKGGRKRNGVFLGNRPLLRIVRKQQHKMDQCLYQVNYGVVMPSLKVDFHWDNQCNGCSTIAIQVHSPLHRDFHVHCWGPVWLQYHQYLK